MKKKIIAISVSLLFGGMLYFSNIHTSDAYYYGPLPGYTGSPHDGKTCDYSGCHNSNPLQSPQPWISSNVPAAGYSPDSVYTITAKAVKVGFSSFGFEISPQSASGAELGTLMNINSSLTQITSVKYIEQTQYSYHSTDSASWTFKWKAPAAGTGPVTFYGAFNCGNGNTVDTGTYVYPATLTIPENISAGISSVENNKTSFSLFPNPARMQINIGYDLQHASNVEVSLYGLDGEKFYTLLNTYEDKGMYTQMLVLPAQIKAGIYFIRLIVDGASETQKIAVEK